MRRLLLLGALAAAFLVPAATAAPPATHSLRGTVVAKDRVHHALVVARAGGNVQTLVAPAAFVRTSVGRTVVIRYTSVTGRLPMAQGVSLKGHTHRAVIRGMLVRLVKRHAIINAGGSVLNVTLKAPKRQRTLASANDGPRNGETVKVEVEIDDDGSLDASAVVAAAAPAGTTAGSEGEMEVRGKVKDPLSATSITVTTGTGFDVTCSIPTGVTLNVKVGDPIELKCDFIGGVWTVRGAHGEGEHSGSDDDASEVKVRGTLSFSLDGASAIVTPEAPGLPVTCAIPSQVLAEVKAEFTAGDVVKMECVEVGGTPTLKEIEKKGGNSGEQSGDDDGDNHDNNDDGDNHESSDD